MTLQIKFKLQLTSKMRFEKKEAIIGKLEGLQNDLDEHFVLWKKTCGATT